MNRYRIDGLILLSGVLLGALLGGSNSSNREQALNQSLVSNINLQEKQDEDLRQTARKTFMRGKLSSVQKIVEGMATKNFSAVAEGAVEIKALVKGQHWFVLQTNEYQDFSAEMERAADRLEQAAKNQSVDTVALRYFDLTLNCVDCHGYIEKQKY
jgi:hypothetical protein